MLAEKKQHLWRELLSSASTQELIWMNGYLSGLLSHKDIAVKELQEASPSSTKITIAYGTETGNAKSLSTKLAAYSKKQGVIAKLVSLEQYKPNDLSKEASLFIVISTQGDGEPPAAAQKFYDHLHANTNKLSDLNYAVLALGDSSYPQFCKTGEDVDQQLQRVGAKRFKDTLKCDTDYEEAATSWFSQALQEISKNPGTQEVKAPKQMTASARQYYKGTILTHVNLNDHGSAKETYHIEIAADADFQPGDSIGIHPPNPEVLVSKIIDIGDVATDKVIHYRNEEQSIYHLLKYKLNITHIVARVVKKYGEIVQQEIPETPISLLDLLTIYPISSADQFEEIIKILEPNAPRLYSISSAPTAHSGEIHITVSRNRFEINEIEKFGLCSDYLSGFEVGNEIEFYVHPNNQFRLPDEDRDIIMIGPGTGIAPFRSYLAEREATGASGQNWLFFGDQHFVSDFLYQTEIQSWHETGLLTQVNVAFSRDQQEKLYVQHKIKEKGDEFYKWLQTGASVYICGSKLPMSKDVEDTILEVLSEHGNYTQEQAAHYLDELKENGRYHKDVY